VKFSGVSAKHIQLIGSALGVDQVKPFWRKSTRYFCKLYIALGITYKNYVNLCQKICEIVGGTIQFKIFFTLFNVLLLLKRVSIFGQKSFKGSGRFQIINFGKRKGLAEVNIQLRKEV